MRPDPCCIACEEAVIVDAYSWPRLFRRMVVCQTCGNKRCPKATNHRLACTGSNEPGQPGSVYRDLFPRP